MRLYLGCVQPPDLFDSASQDQVVRIKIRGAIVACSAVQMRTHAFILKMNVERKVESGMICIGAFKPSGPATRLDQWTFQLGQA